MSKVYYNEYDPFAADWLRQLIAAGHLPAGDVDERSIEDVSADDVMGYTQCHWFAGIGGWPYALRLAAWPDEREIWTGSPPCQPFSTAGKRGGYDDARHLTPKWLELIEQCRPASIAGEQVASAATSDKHHWIDDLQDALEAQGYATGQIIIGASSLGAPHIRQRGWFVAQRVGDGQQPGLEGHSRHGDGSGEPGRLAADEGGSVAQASGVGELADAKRGQLNGVADGEGRHPDRSEAGREQGDGEPAASGKFCGRSGSSNSQWTPADWLWCRDEKWRPVEPGTFPLADGVSNRVGRLRGYGNAIVPQVAAEVIGALMEATA